jgi:hypothetical protein
MGAMSDLGHRRQPKGWPGTAVRLLVTLFFLGLLLLLNRCGAPASTAVPAPPSPDPAQERVQLAVDVEPSGAQVALNGQPVGRTPLALDLGPGTYTVVVTLAGYNSLTETLVLRTGKAASVHGELGQVTIVATQSVMASRTGMPTPAPPAAGGSPTSVPRRLSSRTPVSSPPPTLSPSATPTATIHPVRVRDGTIQVQSYPWAEFLRPVWSEVYGLEILALDRAAYEAASPRPELVIYRALTVENDLLQLTFLPELGGRLYRLVFKRTGNDELYVNPVLKPSPWGPPEQGGWLAAGGMEWGLPVEEHGYLWGVPWEAEVIQSVGEATVLLTAPAGQRLRAQVAVTLRGGGVEVRPRLENVSGAPLDLKFWINAMLAPGAANTVSPDVRFVLPEAVDQVIIHSRGDADLPGPGHPMPWPVFGGRDVSRLGTWNQWLGFFVPDVPAGFAGVYDEAADEGIVRVFPPQVARGVKGFAFGWADPIDPAGYTDDGSAYVELHAGLVPTFDDVRRLTPGEVVTWSEWWYPLAGLGGVRYANRHVALNLEVVGENADIRLAVPADLAAQVSLLLDGELIWEEALALRAGDGWQREVALPAERPERGWLTLQLRSGAGQVWAEYEAEFALR